MTARPLHVWSEHHKTLADPLLSNNTATKMPQMFPTSLNRLCLSSVNHRNMHKSLQAYSPTSG